MVNRLQHEPTHRFGVFELDVRTGELRKHGVRLKLQQQPLQVLSILLECAGDIVTRDDIQKRLWPEDVYGDFDNSINSSIRKLRDALGDDADSPRFIETLPRRGYRFIAPVSEESALPRSLRTAPSEDGSVSPASQNGEDLKLSKKRSRRRSRVLVTVILVTLGAGLAFWLLNSKSKSDSGNALLRAVPLTTYPGYEVLPSFSPEGTRVAFSWLQLGHKYPEVYIKLLGPGEPVRLSSAGGFGPTWSPDGRFVAFLRPVDLSHAAVVVIPTVGGQEREIARITFDAFLIFGRSPAWAVPAPFLAWSANGKWLLTLDQKSPGKTQPHSIVRVSVETGEKRILTSPPPATLGDGGLALSPDGKRLAFTKDSGFWSRDIYIAPLSADLLLRGEPERITFDNKAIAGIAWTGDGKYLVFSSPRNGRTELWKIVPEPGSHPVRLNLTDDEVADIAISRDGKHLVYSHESDDQNIWRASLNHQHVAGPTKFIASTRRDVQARYSPDGNRIAFESNRSGNEEIWICRADASDPVQLTYFGNAWAGAPEWSPDGKNIVFAANAAGNWDIYIVSSAGGKPRPLTKDGADESWPSWSRDGEWIYYFSNRGKQAQIRKVRATGGPEIQVTRKGGLWSDESIDGKDLYYVNEQGLWKMPVAGGDGVEIDQSYQFAAAKNGVYYARCLDSRISPFQLYFLDFKTQRTRTVGVLPGPLGWNIDVSPDGRWVTYSKFDREGSELMLVENFE
jgi:Tol biopolymer transport system component/DNA-binding winged helix-turn-helix (wHTH) protein